MKMRKAVDYGVRGVLYLAAQPEGSVLTGSDICDREGLPQSFMLKIFHLLSKAKILKSYKGRGFALARRPGDITVKEILEAINGPLRLTDVSEERWEREIDSLPSLWLKIEDMINKTLEFHTLEDLVKNIPKHSGSKNTGREGSHQYLPA